MAKKEETPKGRDIHVFTVPDHFHKEVRSIGIVEMNYDEDLRARRRTKLDLEVLQDEQVKESMFEIGGVEVAGKRHLADKLWDNSRARLQKLIIMAFNQVNYPTDSEMDDFLDSKVVTLDSESDREVYTFKVPETLLVSSNGIKTIGVVELFTKEDRSARKKVSRTLELIQDELNRRSVRELDGDVVAQKDVLSWWKSTGHRLRFLIAMAFQDVNEPDQEDADFFLSGQNHPAKPS